MIASPFYNTVSAPQQYDCRLLLLGIKEPFILQKVVGVEVNRIVIAFQVPSRHADVSAVQQGLDQGEDLRAAASSGPAGVQVKRPLTNMEEFLLF